MVGKYSDFLASLRPLLQCVLQLTTDEEEIFILPISVNGVEVKPYLNAERRVEPRYMLDQEELRGACTRLMRAHMNDQSTLANAGAFRSTTIA